MLEGCTDTWVDPQSIFGRIGLHTRAGASAMLSEHGLEHQIVVTTAEAVRSKDTLGEIAPDFGPWTDCAVFDAKLMLAMRIVAFERVEDAVMYRLIIQ